MATADVETAAYTDRGNVVTIVDDQPDPAINRPRERHPWGKPSPRADRETQNQIMVTSDFAAAGQRS
jgi:hypothetical protein